MYDGLNNIWSLEVRPSSGLKLSLARRNWEKRGINQLVFPISLPRFEPGFTAAQICSHIRTGPKVFSSGLHLEL